jgi:hypothetical protein
MRVKSEGDNRSATTAQRIGRDSRRDGNNLKENTIMATIICSLISVWIIMGIVSRLADIDDKWWDRLAEWICKRRF